MPAALGFPRSERLTCKKEFTAVYEHGEKRVGRAFVYYLVRDQGRGRKLGITVSKKVGAAVVRNRVKRYLREIYRAHRPRLDQDVQMVWVARPACATLSFNECRTAIRALLEKGDVLHD